MKFSLLFVLKALKKVGKFVNIQEVMDQWTLQMGYPVITIKGNETAENIVGISQEHFIYDLDVKNKDRGLGNNRYSTFIVKRIMLYLILMSLC